MNKDYYYILGVKKESSLGDIKKAYRKLSLKFHPDKNDGDSFFEERFKDIQEAYETLSHPNRREEYDRVFQNDRTSNTNFNYEPTIEYFKCDKNAFEYDREITFEWKCINADICELKPFGKIPLIGSKTVKFKDFKSPSLKFELIAINNYIEKKATANLLLTNNTYLALRKDIIAAYEDEKKSTYSQHRRKKSEKSETQDGEMSATMGWLFLAALFILLWVFTLIFD